MSATILSDPIAISSAETQSAGSTKLIAQIIEVEFVKCDCCGLTEECTPAYIERVRERHGGKWICGLCSEAINYEILRSDRLTTAEEALENHMNLCKKFTASALKPPLNPTVHLITAMKQIMRRSLDSNSHSPASNSRTRSMRMRSTPTSPTMKDSTPAVLPRSGSCFSSISGL